MIRVSNIEWMYYVTPMNDSLWPWRIHMCGVTLVMRAMTHSYAWHGSFIRVIRLIYMCDRTHLYARWQNSCIYVTWPIHLKTQTLSSKRSNKLTYQYITSQTLSSEISQTHVSTHHKTLSVWRIPQTLSLDYPKLCHQHITNCIKRPQSESSKFEKSFTHNITNCVILNITNSII